MGGAVSSGVNNDELIDNLLEADYIRSPLIERVFRAVDRADYFVPHARSTAYKDLAWKLGNLHLSAPCIYSEVLEGLKLEPGLSFLNLGSGTGYLSTLVGLVLGRTGINHGLEFYKEVLDYANAKLELFQKNSEALDEFDFCAPIFKEANCLEYNPQRKYDRVYCGASCPPEYEEKVMRLLEIGGILVMPSNDHLVQIKRNAENDFAKTTLIPVSFATLITPADNEGEIIEPIVTSPATLQHLSRCVIRSLLRNNVEKENPQIMLRNRKSSGDCKGKSKRICRSSSRNDDENNLNPFLPVYCRRRGPVVVAEYWESESESEDETGEIEVNVENAEENVPERMDCACTESSSDSSFDELDDNGSAKRRMKRCPDESCTRCAPTVDESTRNETSTSDSDVPASPIQAPLHLYVVNRYGAPMRERIQQLPLPQILKRYLNYMRDFQ